MGDGAQGAGVEDPPWSYLSGWVFIPQAQSLAESVVSRPGGRSPVFPPSESWLEGEFHLHSEGERGASGQAGQALTTPAPLSAFLHVCLCLSPALKFFAYLCDLMFLSPLCTPVQFLTCSLS